jgi:hypothetical protein
MARRPLMSMRENSRIISKDLFRFTPIAVYTLKYYVSINLPDKTPKNKIIGFGSPFSG